MNVKDIAYHWTTSYRLQFIFKQGLKTSGGRHMTGVYLDTSGTDMYVENSEKSALIGVHLRGLERGLYLLPNKKWIISTIVIPPENLFLIGEQFPSIEQLRIDMQTAKERFKHNNTRASWPIRIEQIKVYTKAH